MEQSDADQIVAALRCFDQNFLLVGNIPAGDNILCIRRLQDRIAEIERIDAHDIAAELWATAQARHSFGFGHTISLMEALLIERLRLPANF